MTRPEADAPPFDAGLQLERTSLSWRRTALSIAVGSLVSLRLFPVWLGGAGWIVPGMLGLVAAATLWLVSKQRHRAFMARVARGAEPRVSGAASIALISLGVVAAGLFALIAVIVTRL